jgi:DNA-binding response OmpR family regulator
MAISKFKILVVDDEPEVVSLVHRRLEREGYLVSTALNGREGLIVAQKEKPNLILLDIIMPEVDGISMLRSLRMDKALGAIPVILLTARSDISSIDEGRKYGAEDYFIKPIEWDQLLKFIRKYIDFNETLRKIKKSQTGDVP